MSTVRIEPLLHYYRREKPSYRSPSKSFKLSFLNALPKKLVYNGRSFCNFQPPTPRALTLRAASTDAATVETFESTDLFFKETFPLKRTEVVWALPFWVVVFFCWFVESVCIVFGENKLLRLNLKIRKKRDCWAWIWSSAISIDEQCFQSWKLVVVFVYFL